MCRIFEFATCLLVVIVIIKWFVIHDCVFYRESVSDTVQMYVLLLDEKIPMNLMDN